MSENDDTLNAAKNTVTQQSMQAIKIVYDKAWQAFEKVIDLLGGRTIAMLAMALLVTLLSVFFSDHWIVSVNKQGVFIAEVRANIMGLQELKSHLYQAESAQRGYLYTRRAVYLEPFDLAITSARAKIEKLETSLESAKESEDKHKGLNWLKQISANLEAKAAEMKVTINLVKSGKTIEAKQVVNLDEGFDSTNEFILFCNTLIQNQNNQLDALTAKRHNTISLARASVIGGALVLIVLVVLVIKQLLAEIVIKSQLQKMVVKENEIYEEKLQLQTKLLRSLALDYQADVERERQKLSRELHDELGSIFTATKMDIAWVMKKVKDIAPEIVAKLTKTSSYVDQGIQYQRHIVQELHPSMLSTFGFWPSLQSLINDAADRNQWDLTLNLPDENTQLNETISLVVYRIVQESLNNANKYAQATAISVDVILDALYVKLEVQDNGVGINMDELIGNTHGLSGMRHRVLAIGGRFEMHSEPGKGMLIRALIPLDVAV